MSHEFGLRLGRQTSAYNICDVHETSEHDSDVKENTARQTREDGNDFY